MLWAIEWDSPFNLTLSIIQGTVSSSCSDAHRDGERNQCRIRLTSQGKEHFRPPQSKFASFSEKNYDSFTHCWGIRIQIQLFVVLGLSDPQKKKSEQMSSLLVVCLSCSKNDLLNLDVPQCYKSVTFWYRSGSADRTTTGLRIWNWILLFSSVTFELFSHVFSFYLPKVHLHQYRYSKIKSYKKSQNFYQLTQAQSQITAF